MTTIVEFLTKRLNEIERVAKAAVRDDMATGEWTVVPGPANGRPSISTDGIGWETSSGDGIWLCDDPQDECGQYRAEDDAEAAHIALNDPAYVLQRVAADRRILERHRQCGTGVGWCDDGGHGISPTDGSDWVDEGDDDGGGLRCRDLEDLAAPFADHPDFVEAWRR